MVKWIIKTTDGKLVECYDNSSLLVYLNTNIERVYKIER